MKCAWFLFLAQARRLAEPSTRMTLFWECDPENVSLGALIPIPAREQSETRQRG